MMQHPQTRKFACFLLSVVALSITLFSLCYQWDNKYTRHAPPAERGVVHLESGLPADGSALFLTHGWLVYRDALLLPQDFEDSTALPPAQEVFIGQYGGFEGDDFTRSPHGSATYRLQIALPKEIRVYALELPEIFSAYTLYINGIRAEQFGNPAPNAYHPQTGNAILAFPASGRLDLVFAVSDFSHTYSGMVYPPAFGTSQAVSSLLSLRLAIRTAVCAVALALAICFLVAGIRLRRNRAMLLFGLLCICFVGYTCYPILKTIARGGLWLYALENLCFVLLLLFVMLLQRTITGDRGRLATASILFGALVCFAYLLRPLFPSDSLQTLALYSLLIGCYKWIAALFLTVSMLRAAGKRTRYGYTMLAGVLVFDCALIMDRLLPLHEPILLGWFLEIAGFFMVMTLGMVMVQELVQQFQEKLTLEGKIDGIEQLVSMQQSYYPVILESVEEARRARHDLRHHLRVLQSLASTENTEALSAYLQNFAAGIAALPPLTYCENYVVDVILRHFAALCAQQGVSYTVQVAIPEMLPIENADLCRLMSNLLENALEACAYVPHETFLSIRIALVQSQLVLRVQNCFDGSVRSKNGRFFSRKRLHREGIGLASVHKIAQKYAGTAMFIPDAKTGIFTSEITLSVSPHSSYD